MKGSTSHPARSIKVDGLPRAPSEDISKSVSSIDSGAIFPSRSGHELSRNVGGMSVYALYKKLYGRIDFL